MRFSLFLLLAVLVAVGPAEAQTVSIDFGSGNGDGALSARIIQLFLLVTVLSLAPGIAMMVTCFPFMVTVLSILRQAIGVQQAPPNMLIISLALFLTYFVMQPVFTKAWETGLSPLMNGDITEVQAMENTLGPFEEFMTARVDEDTLAMLSEIAPERVKPGEAAPFSILVPAFMLSEIARAFEIGFLVFLPFLIIDMVVASILMSMGMMMVPPVVVSLPFKLAFFVLADGWSLIAGALVRGYPT